MYDDGYLTGQDALAVQTVSSYYNYAYSYSGDLQMAYDINHFIHHNTKNVYLDGNARGGLGDVVSIYESCPSGVTGIGQ